MIHCDIKCDKLGLWNFYYVLKYFENSNVKGLRKVAKICFKGWIVLKNLIYVWYLRYFRKVDEKFHIFVYNNKFLAPDQTPAKKSVP